MANESMTPEQHYARARKVLEEIESPGVGETYVDWHRFELVHAHLRMAEVGAAVQAGLDEWQGER